VENVLMETSPVLTNFGPKRVRERGHLGYSEILAATNIFQVHSIKLQTRINWLRSKYSCSTLWKCVRTNLEKSWPLECLRVL